MDEKICAASLRKKFAGCDDFTLRRVWPGGRETEGVSLCWLDGLVSGAAVAEDVLRPLTDALRVFDGGDPLPLLRGAVYAGTVQERHALSEAAEDLLNGFCALVFDGRGVALSFEVKTETSRSIGEPSVEKTVKGAKDAFVETLRVNTSLVRRKLRSPQLKLGERKLGRRSGTAVAVLYLEGVADPATVEKLQRRLAAIDVDGITAAGGIEQYIVDAPRSPFPQLLHTERPDRFAAELLNGRVGILVDGLPIGFLAPATLSAFLRVGEDHAQHFLAASLLTMLRYLAFLATALLPALLVAVSMYHQEMIPFKLMTSMIDAKQQVPFSAAVEVLSMLLAFELLQEAGLRLPNPVGDTVSIIGALIVGQAAVEARVVSPVAVIVVAAAGICGFTQPSQDVGAALRLARAGMVLLAIALGMYGIMLGLSLLLWHLCGIESFGVSYAAPLSDGSVKERLRVFLQLPLWRERTRPAELHPQDIQKQKDTDPPEEAP